MSTSGFVQAVKARGNYFFYVRISYRDKDKKPRNKNIFSLGQKEKAIKLLNSWVVDREIVPEELKKYNEDDFKRWITYVEGK